MSHSNVQNHEGRPVLPQLELRKVADTTTGIGYLHAYSNSRPTVDQNTCGQAAIATILDFYRLDPFGLSRPVHDDNDSKTYWQDGEVIDRVRAKFPPDVAFGLLGTSGGRLVDAFKKYGLRAECAFSGAGSIGWGDLWNSLQQWIAAKHPVPVILDTGAIGGPWGNAHWAIVYKIENSRVYIGNWERKPILDEQTFLHAWHCQFLPYGFNHCGVYVQR